MSIAPNLPWLAPSKRWTAVVVLLTLLAAVSLRAALVAHKTAITHDEGISYLAATCHQGTYVSAAATPPRVAPASYWKDFLRVDARGCFGQIARDLGELDIHPPLYFWLLHLWSLVFGVHAWTGPALNIGIALLTTLALYAMAYQTLGRRNEAALVILTYALNPGVMLSSLEARQYELLTLWGVLLAWQVARFADDPRVLRRGPLLLISSAAGALTHHQFVLFILGCGLYLGIRLARSDRAHLGGALLALIAGYVATQVAHPYLGASFSEVMIWQAGGFELGNVLPNMRQFILAHAPFYYVLGLAAALGVWALCARARRREGMTLDLRRPELRGMSLLFFFAWASASLGAMYVLSLSPAHAMSPKYLGIAWPFLAFLPVLILRLTSYRRTLLLYFTLVPLIYGAITPALLGERTRDHSALLEGAETVLIDNTARGVLPRMIWHIPEDMPVVVAVGEALLEDPEYWFSSLGDNSLYMSHLAYCNTEATREAVIAALEAQGYEVEPTGQHFASVGLMFRLHRPASSAAE